MLRYVIFNTTRWLDSILAHWSKREVHKNLKNATKMIFFHYYFFLYKEDFFMKPIAGILSNLFPKCYKSSATSI